MSPTTLEIWDERYLLAVMSVRTYYPFFFVNFSSVQQECCLRGIQFLLDQETCIFFRVAPDDCEALEDECCSCCQLGLQTRTVLGESGCEILAVNTQGDCREVFLGCCLDTIGK